MPDKAQAAPQLTEAQKKERLAIISHKLRVAQRQDSLRTGNQLEPGTKQQFHITNWNGPGEPIVTVTRVKLSEPADGTVGIASNSANEYTQTPQPPQPLAGGASHVAMVQNVGPVYTFVEQMPQPPGGGGTAAIVQAIQRGLVYPAGEKAEGRVFATFTVAADGTVREAKIVKGLNPACDAAVLTAIQQLPRFMPGKQHGRAVAVSYTVPIQFKLKA